MSTICKWAMLKCMKKQMRKQKKMSYQIHLNWNWYRVSYSACGDALDLNESVCIKWYALVLSLISYFMSAKWLCRVCMESFNRCCTYEICHRINEHFQIRRFDGIRLKYFQNATPNSWTIVWVYAFVLDCRPIHHSLRIVFAVIVTVSDVTADAALFLYHICLHCAPLRFHWNWCI